MVALSLVRWQPAWSDPIPSSQIAAPAQLGCDIGGDVLGPFFRGVEADDPNRVLVLPFEHVHDDRFEVGALHVGFPVGRRKCLVSRRRELLPAGRNVGRAVVATPGCLMRSRC